MWDHLSDPGFLRRGRQLLSLEQKQLCDKVFAQKGRIKMTEIGQREERPECQFFSFLVSSAKGLNLVTRSLNY